ncbi:hypothetical protein CIB84_010315 [Bambusicola thoracicus]|uniref:DDB1- and CUL4-associated factor 10 n=1 Tax=Bambusicola thoracicus TaxID=9083 RepID=A0A2P4SP98_BAMTH|nr:hypothetical protein CIB84_010315 [Bambusicola thoracicus]
MGEALRPKMERAPLREVCVTAPRGTASQSVLTVACEQTEVLLFDPISSKHIKTLSEAHEDCVNNIRFLDNRLFATCSDDTTIALWDLRKLNTKVCTLHGHTSWVKNIEYDTNTRLLVTSGFDGNVIIWDTNSDGNMHVLFLHEKSVA